jgi:translocator protein
MKFTWKEAGIFVAIVFSPLVLGSVSGFLGQRNNWYDDLKKPSFAPPPVAFGIVWPILYVMMGGAAYIALRHAEWKYWVLYILQLVSNLLFSPVNFGLQSLLGGAILTTATGVLAGATTLQYGAIQKKYWAVLLMIPYLIWLTFASVLAWTFYGLNA